MRLTVDKAKQAIRDYCQGDSQHPFFVCVDGSTDMRTIVNSLTGGFSKIRLSTYCGEDTLPDYDRFIADISKSSHNSVVLGLGESSFLTGEHHAYARIKDISTSKKVVVICRHGENSLETIARSDSKFTLYRWCSVQSSADYSVLRVDTGLPIEVIKGFRALLSALESGRNGKIYVSTDVDLANSSTIRTAYDAIRVKMPSFIIPRCTFSDDIWEQYLANPELKDTDIKSWRFYLRMLLEEAPTPYLRLVLRESSDYTSYKKQLLCAILKVDWQTTAFEALYDERKKYLNQFTDYEIEEYVQAAKERDKYRVHYLTDRTLVERRAIIEEISKTRQIPEELPTLYPALSKYLHEYRFGGNNGAQLTQYFSEYKRLKVLNYLPEDFLVLVNAISEPTKRAYTQLRTRKQILASAKTGLDNPGLYWMDALGVEFLGYIQALAHDLGLSLKVEIARASLPTLTCYNKDFFDTWTGPKAEPDKRLDDLKHHGCDGLVRTDDADGTKYLPIYLADELSAVEKAIHSVQLMLTQHKADQVFLVSDHGASRLAVLNNHENKWEMASKGQHSGRCCPLNEVDEAPLSATREERDMAFWVLANYDRFKGGRKADVEVHGGATLEEIIVPVLCFELMNNTVDCHILGDSVIIESLDGNPVVPLYCSDSRANIVLCIKGKSYKAVQDPHNDSKYVVTLEGMWRNGDYVAEVYNGDNRLEDLVFTIEKVKRNNSKKRDGSEFFV